MARLLKKIICFIECEIVAITYCVRRVLEGRKCRLVRLYLEVTSCLDICQNPEMVKWF